MLRAKKKADIVCQLITVLVSGRGETFGTWQPPEVAAKAR